MKYILILVGFLLVFSPQASSQPWQIVVSNGKTSEEYIVTQQKTVRVYCESKKGKYEIQNATIQSIEEHAIQFVPFNQIKYKPTAYTDSTLEYIEIKSSKTELKAFGHNAGIVAVYCAFAASLFSFPYLLAAEVPPALVTLIVVTPYAIIKFADFTWQDSYRNIHLKKGNANTDWKLRIEPIKLPTDSLSTSTPRL